MITIDDFSKIEIKIGTVLEAEKVPDADKLIRLIFDFGSSADSGQVSVEQNSDESNKKYPGKHIRQVISAIAGYYPDPSVLVNKEIAVITNLEPRKFRGYESQGMIMATDNENGIVLLTPEKKVKSGAKIH